MRVLADRDKELLEDLFAACQDSEGGVVVYNEFTTRNKYLANWANWLRYHEALASLGNLPPEDPLYARGIYWNIRSDNSPEGLVIQRVPKFLLAGQSIYHEVAFRKESISLTYCSPDEAHRRARTMKREIERHSARWRGEIIDLKANKSRPYWWPFDVKLAQFIRDGFLTIRIKVEDEKVTFYRTSDGTAKVLSLEELAKVQEKMHGAKLRMELSKKGVDPFE